MAITKITGASIAADSIDGTKIADDAVNSEHLTDGGIDNAHIATGVDASKLTTGTLPAARISSLDATKLTGTIASGRLSAANLGSGTVPTARLGSGTANSGVFLRGDNTWAAAGSTSASDLSSGTLPIARIADDAVTNAKMADDAIDSAQIAAGAVDDAHLATGISASKLTGALPAISGASLTGISSQGRNLFINGGFDVWQRGTSGTHQTTYLADRWYNATSSTVSRQTFTVGQTDVSHFPTYYIRQVTGSTEWYGLKQKIENVGITAGREVTLSYWMKGSSAFTNAPFRNQNFGDSGSSEVNAALSTASITTSWARYTHTFTLPSISGKTVGDNNYLQIQLLRANVNNLTIEIANCQLEFGDTATDFEQRSYGEELALCQRYFYHQKTNGSGEGYTYVLDGNHYPLLNVNFPVTMRAEPGFSSNMTSSHRFRIDSVSGVYGAWSEVDSVRTTNDAAVLLLERNTNFVTNDLGVCGWCDSRAGTILLYFDAEL